MNAYQVIVFEDLAPLEMGKRKGRGMRKSIMDVAWTQFISMTIGKAAEAGRTVILVDPRNTSKMCSDCGELVQKTLSDAHPYLPELWAGPGSGCECGAQYLAPWSPNTQVVDRVGWGGIPLKPKPLGLGAVTYPVPRVAAAPAAMARTAWTESAARPEAGLA